MRGSIGFLKGFGAFGEYKYLGTVQKEITAPYVKFIFLRELFWILLLWERHWAVGRALHNCICVFVNMRIYESIGWHWVNSVSYIIGLPYLAEACRRGLTWTGRRLNNKTDSRKNLCHLFRFNPFQNYFVNLTPGPSRLKVRLQLKAVTLLLRAMH